MANSTIITSLKDYIINAMVEDETFFYAIDPDTEFEDSDGNVVENASDLPGKYIFRYNKNPETVKEVCTFITVLVDTHYRDYNKTYITPSLSICIYSHYNHMEFTKEQSKTLGFDKRITDNRNDYIAKLIDEKFNKVSQGINQLKLVSNTEGNATTDFLYRQLVFETIDVNDSFCGGGDSL